MALPEQQPTVGYTSELAPLKFLLGEEEIKLREGKFRVHSFLFLKKLNFRYHLFNT